MERGTGERQFFRWVGRGRVAENLGHANARAVSMTPAAGSRKKAAFSLLAACETYVVLQSLTSNSSSRPQAAREAAGRALPLASVPANAYSRPPTCPVPHHRRLSLGTGPSTSDDGLPDALPHSARSTTRSLDIVITGFSEHIPIGSASAVRPRERFRPRSKHGWIRFIPSSRKLCTKMHTAAPRTTANVCKYEGCTVAGVFAPNSRLGRLAPRSRHREG